MSYDAGGQPSIMAPGRQSPGDRERSREVQEGNLWRSFETHRRPGHADTTADYNCEGPWM